MGFVRKESLLKSFSYTLPFPAVFPSLPLTLNLSAKGISYLEQDVTLGGFAFLFLWLLSSRRIRCKMSLLSRSSSRGIWIVKRAECCRKAASLLVLLETWRGLLGQRAWELDKEKEVDNSERGNSFRNTHLPIQPFLGQEKKEQELSGPRIFFCLSDLSGFKHHCIFLLRFLKVLRVTMSSIMVTLYRHR